MVSPFDQLTSAVSRVQREIILARFLGKLAVDQGLAEVRQRLDAMWAEPDDDPTMAAVESRGTPADSPEPPVPPRRSPSPHGGGGADLALADYDSLPASAIVAKLDGLEPDELDAIEEYEQQRRRRRTVLGRIRQLREVPT